jgi:hypothetical protein
MDFLMIAGANLTSPMVLCFALGVAAAMSRSELAIPEAAARFMSLYLLFAIGFKGGAEVARHGLGPDIAYAVLAGIALSLLLPVLAYALMRFGTRLTGVDAAAVAAHYGSISIVTFVAATQALEEAGLTHDGYMVAVAAAMEAPAIMMGLMLASRHLGASERSTGELGREILLNGSIVILVGAFAIGWISGDSGLEAISGFIVTPFKGVLCLFLLDMGLLAGKHMRASAGKLSPATLAVGIYMPLVGAAVALPIGLLISLSPGSLALLLTLAASGSYIAAPAALRIALPQANPAIYLTLSLGLTFPFNLTLGVPLYISLAEALA